MQRLLNLAEDIKDRKLREKVVDILKNPKPGHPDFAMNFSIDDCPSHPESRQPRAGGLIEHTLSVAELSRKMATHFMHAYKVEIDLDMLLAAAIIHDIYKTVEFGIENKKYVISEIYLNHLDLMIAELYARRFPKEVIHIIASHFGENSPTPPLTYEALCLHYADTYDSIIATNVEKVSSMQNQILQEYRRIMSIAEEKGKKA